MISFRLETGKDTFQDISSRKQTFFTGQCFKCGCWRHTQLECPLSQCKICGKYGHDARICELESEQNIRKKKSHS